MEKFCGEVVEEEAWWKRGKCATRKSGNERVVEERWPNVYALNHIKLFEHF